MKPTSFRFPDYTEAQIKRLCKRHELHRLTLVMLALERFEAQTMAEYHLSDVTVGIDEDGVITEAEMLRFRALLQE